MHSAARSASAPIPASSRASRSCCRRPNRPARPSRDGPARASRMSDGTMNSGNGKRSFKLMIVDDSNLMRRRIERSQQFEELQLVGTAADGVEALELFKKTDLDVVTMDF